jgi:hypothetical protein
MVNRVAGGHSEYLCVNADVYNVNMRIIIDNFTADIKGKKP